MRKTIFIFVILGLLLCATSCNSDSESTIPDSTNTYSSETTQLSQTLQFNENDLHEMLKDIQELGLFSEYSTVRYSIHKESSTYGTVYYTTEDNEQIEKVCFLAYSGASSTSFGYQNAKKSQNAIIEYCDSANIDYIASLDEVEDTYVFSVCASGSNLVDQDLPIYIREFRSTDEFFADDTRRETYSNMLNRADYAKIYELITTFADTMPVTDNDAHIVTTINEKSAALVENAEQCLIEFDEINGETTIRYNDIQDLNSETCIVPFLTCSKYGCSFEYKIGFIKSNWLFFDSIVVKSDSGASEKVDFNTYDVNQDIISGQVIVEYVYTSSQFRDILSECVSNGGQLRFENAKTGEVFEHTITTQELNAISVLEQIASAHSTLYYLLSGWENA